MATNQLSQDQTVRARKNYRAEACIDGMCPWRLQWVATRPTISRMKPEKFEQFAQILAVLDLKIVPNEMRCFNERDIEMLIHASKRWMEHIHGVDQLQEE
ncbi:CII family transcriptional regulator [Pseudomonas gorinensis]